MRGISLVTLLVALGVTSVTLLGVGVREGGADDLLGPGPASSGSASVGLGAAGTGIGDVSAAAGMRFGIDAAAIDEFSAQAGPPDYATVWVGRWNLDKGWRDTDAALKAIAAQNVTPAVHLWYWGDDMQRSCLEPAGCDGKTMAWWNELAAQLVVHLQQDLGGKPVLIILESEFNKHGVHDSEVLDEALAEKANYIRYYYPQAQVVLGFGNWFPQAWPTFDRAAAAADYVGLQAMAASTRDGKDEQVGLADATVEGARRLRELFQKPVIVQDVAVSSYPEPESLDTQEQAVVRLAGSLPDLREAGVEAVIYRSFLDVPDMPLENHFAEAERHWGLAWYGSGELKPAGQAWFMAVQQTRAAQADMGEVARPGAAGGP